jgi:hypothetical protein
VTHQAQVRQTETAQPEPSGQVPRIIDLLEELHGVIGAENNLLAGGLPASLARTVARKTQLANELDGWLQLMRSGEFGKGSAPEEIAELVSRLQSLRVLMGENSLAIKRSMEASRRRIDGIMRALRDEPTQAGIYGGRLPRGNAPGRYV